MPSKTRSFLVALLLTPATFAAKAEGPKAKIMAKYDLDHDGKLSADEIATIRKDFAAAPTGELARFDTNKDGKPSDDEIAKMIPGSGKKGGDKKEKSGAKSGDKPKDAPAKTEDAK
ncbi:hypothetical protein [Opitutus sp. GAS368]|jgi:hypothetical protein|uniref:hypothetical protein n=1 Tax=Opitutus sp. GAS368 TaxID=1882749 RepID=UPI00087BECF2|nr:hypothetical protein [Opitutus sp. GAS368]SDS00639.1 EF hand [Opitutus sp. GAS368]